METLFNTGFFEDLIASREMYDRKLKLQLLL